MRDLLSILVAGTISLVIAAANISYSMSLGLGQIFGLPLSYVFAALGLSLEGAMILSTFTYKEADRPRRAVLALIFIIASTYCIHSTYGFLKQQTNNLTTKETIDQTYRKELDMRLQDLEKTKKRDYTQIETLRQKLTPPIPTPVQGFELYLSFALWFLHSFIWWALLTSTSNTTTQGDTHSGHVSADTGANNGESKGSNSRGRDSLGRWHGGGRPG